MGEPAYLECDHCDHGEAYIVARVWDHAEADPGCRNLALCYLGARSDGARLERENADLRRSYDLVHSLVGLEDGVERRLLRMVEENASLRSDLASARALAVELGKCRECRGTGKAGYVFGVKPSKQTTVIGSCGGCSGTGLDSRVPKEWLPANDKSNPNL